MLSSGNSQSVNRYSQEDIKLPVKKQSSLISNQSPVNSRRSARRGTLQHAGTVEVSLQKPSDWATAFLAEVQDRMNGNQVVPDFDKIKEESDFESNSFSSSNEESSQKTASIDKKGRSTHTSNKNKHERNYSQSIQSKCAKIKDELKELKESMN